MPTEPKNPFAGKKGTITAVVVIGGGVSAYMIYKYEKNKKQNAAAAAGTAYGYGTPGYAYGYGYGTNAVSSPYGYGLAGGGVTPYPYGEEYGYGAYGYGDYNPYTGQYLGGGTGSVIGTGPGAVGGGTGNAQTQQQWLSAAAAQLEKDGYSPVATEDALGRYLLGLPLSTQQLSIVTAAIGVEGEPPGNVPAPNTTGGGTGQNQGSTKITVPNVVGMRVEYANQVLKSEGFNSTFPQRKPDTPYVVTAESPKAGTSQNKGTAIHLSIKATNVGTRKNPGSGA